jgi:hypothetical protein
LFKISLECQAHGEKIHIAVILLHQEVGHMKSELDANQKIYLEKLYAIVNSPELFLSARASFLMQDKEETLADALERNEGKINARQELFGASHFKKPENIALLAACYESAFYQLQKQVDKELNEDNYDAFAKSLTPESEDGFIERLKENIISNLGYTPDIMKESEKEVTAPSIEESSSSTPAITTTNEQSSLSSNLYNFFTSGPGLAITTLAVAGVASLAISAARNR